MGMLLLILAYYCFEAARLEMAPFFEWSVKARSAVIVFFTLFVLPGYAPPMLIFFGIVDLLGAFGTGLALRSPVTATA